MRCKNGGEAYSPANPRLDGRGEDGNRYKTARPKAGQVQPGPGANGGGRSQKRVKKDTNTDA